MNKIQRLVFTMACLLIALVANAYKIEALTPTAGGTLVAKIGETTIVAGTDVGATEITYNTLITLTVTPASGYYLQSLTWEEVTDLGQAESPLRRVNGPGIQTIHTITLSDPEHNYGGDYTFYMPSTNVIVTATFKLLTNFSDNPLLTFELDNIAYNGLERTLVVKFGGVLLSKGDDYNITDITFNSASQGPSHIVKNAGTYTFTVQGIGIYQGSKTSQETIEKEFTIGKAPLTITPKNKSRQYRDENPIYSNTSSGISGDFTYTGLVGGEDYTVLTNQPVATIDANQDTGVGNYTVTASGAAAANYNISYTTGTLTITQRNVNDANTQAVATLSDETYADFNTNQYYKYDPTNIVVHEPTVTVTDPSDSNHPLVNGTDFDVAYAQEPSGYGDAEHKTPGMYTATITFKGNYTGSIIIKKYQIRKKVSLPYAWNTYYYTDVAMKVPDGMEAFTMTSIATNLVVIREQNYILKDVPMLLYSTNTDFNPELVKVADATRVGADPVSDFIGIETDLDMAATASGDDTHDYWILIDGSFVRTKSGILAAHKCYLKRLKTQHATPSISLVREYDSTGIDYVNNSSLIGDGIYYDLSGRRVQKPTKGLYILNGKKIIIK